VASTTTVTTRVPAPRVPFLDERTGAVSREWYRFLTSLTGTVDATASEATQDFTLDPLPGLGLSDLAVLQAQADAFATLPPDAPQPARYYGDATSVTLQTAAVINTAYAVGFNVPRTEFGVRVVSTSRITFDNAGRYLILATLQANLAAGPAGTINTWLRFDGSTSVTNSATLTQIAAPTTLSLSYLVSVAAGQYAEVMWAVSDVDIQLQTTAAAAPVPAVPSAALTVVGVLWP